MGIGIRHIGVMVLGLMCMGMASLHAQSLRGCVMGEEERSLEGAHVELIQNEEEVGHALTDSLGCFEVRGMAYGLYRVRISMVGYVDSDQEISFDASTSALSITMKRLVTHLDEVVVAGSWYEKNLKESLEPIRVYSSEFLENQSSSSLYENLTNITGVTAQLDCSICYTSSVSIGGVDSRHTQYLIDNMPSVSSLAFSLALATLSNTFVERLEILRGAASTRYGSDAIGGTVHIVTKDPFQAPRFNASYRINSYLEQQAVISGRVGRNDHAFVAVADYFDSSTDWDRNKDGFKDLANQKRLSLLGTYSMRRPEDRQLSLTARGMYEDRLVGQLGWEPIHRGTDEVYGESIYTNQFMFLGRYQLPTSVPLFMYSSYTYHDQNAAYGDAFFLARQHTVFSQFFWEEPTNQTDKVVSWMAGADVRAIFYSDNTGVRNLDDGLVDARQPLTNVLWGAFVEPRFRWGDHTLSTGARAAYHNINGFVFSPRAAYNWQIDNAQTFKASVAHGFKVVDFFSESHIGLDGGRTLVVADNLLPEQSYALYLNYLRQQPVGSHFVDIDIYTGTALFFNAIQLDYDRNDEQIFYENLNNNSWNVQLGLGTNWFFDNDMQLNVGLLYVINRFRQNEGIASWQQPYKLPPFQLQVSWQTPVVWGIEASWTAQLYSPMRLPVVDADPRPGNSPWYSMQEMRIAKTFKHGISAQIGVKNLFNVVPVSPVLRPFDPFDKQVDSPDNPNGHTFDTSYGYLPIQGIRAYVGIGFTLD